MAQRLPRAVIKVRKLNFQGLVNYAQFIHDNTTGNASFPTPSPTMAALQTAIDNQNAAIADWGPVGNRGSHAEYLVLLGTNNVLYGILLQLRDYVNNLVDRTTSYVDQANFILSSGFTCSNSSAPQGQLAQPLDFHQLFQPSVNPATPKLKYKKPVGLTSPGNVRFYKLYRKTVNVVPVNDDDVIATPTKTTYIDTTAAAATKYWYWVRGFNAAGDGVLSEALVVNTPA